MHGDNDHLMAGAWWVILKSLDLSIFFIQVQYLFNDRISSIYLALIPGDRRGPWSLWCPLLFSPSQVNLKFPLQFKRSWSRPKVLSLGKGVGSISSLESWQKDKIESKNDALGQPNSLNRSKHYQFKNSAYFGRFWLDGQHVCFCDLYRPWLLVGDG